MIEDTLEYKAQVRLLTEAGQRFAQRGWVPATTGQLSARLNAQQIVITRAGSHTGCLDPSAFLAVDLDGQVLSPGKRPAPETFLHIIMYRRDPAIGAVLHTHSANAALLARRFPHGLTLTDDEVLTAFPGIDSHEAELPMPVFANRQDIRPLAAQVDATMDRHPELYGYLVGGRGLYTWGASVEAAQAHAEAFEFLLECAVLNQSLGT